MSESGSLRDAPVADPLAQAPPVILLVYEFWDAAIAALEGDLGRYPNIWVIDNHSPTDRSVEVQKRFSAIRVIRTPRNGGWAYGYNLALALAAEEGHRSAFLLNSDTAPESGAIEQALASLRSLDRAAAVGSVILSWDGQTAEFDGKLYRDGEGPPAAAVSREMIESDRVHGAAMAISLDAFREVGPFHEDYFLYHEETDWLIRCQSLGWSLWADGQSRVRHMAGGSMVGVSKRYYLTRNRFIANRRGLSLSGLPETFWTVLWEEAGHLYADNPQERFGAKQGIIDGILGRGGKRIEPRLKWWIDLQIFPLRCLMKIRRLIFQTRPTNPT